MVNEEKISTEQVLGWLSEITDPEIPVLSITDLGIVREVSVDGKAITVSITPTYSGCPAMDIIRMQIRMKLLEHGFDPVNIKEVLSPAWTTEWITGQGKARLAEYGIAPPNPKQQVCEPGPFAAAEAVSCPRCHSYHTHLVSRFGSTPCKALYQCDDCQEPFDYFKCH